MTTTQFKYRSGWCSNGTHGRCVGTQGSPDHRVDCLCSCHTIARAQAETEAREHAAEVEAQARIEAEARAALDREETFVRAVETAIAFSTYGETVETEARRIIAMVRAHDLEGIEP